MKIVKITLEVGPDGDWWVHTDEAMGFFGCGETREEALDNARDALSLILDVDEDSIELVVVETRTLGDGGD